jgi:hypothetical protein
MTYVHVPDDHSDISREQLGALLGRINTNIAIARYRFEGGFGDSDTEPNRDALDDDEKALHKQTTDTLKKLVDRVEMPPLVRLAHEAPSAPEEIEVSEQIDKLLGDYNSDLGKFLRNQPAHELIRLAMVVLEYADLDDVVPKLLGVLAGDLQTSSSNGWNRSTERDRPVHACPRCDGNGNLGGTRWSKITCNRCKGSGYLLQGEAPDDEEECLSIEGRRAINAGQPWTERQEAEEQGCDSLEEWHEHYGPLKGVDLVRG